jgi:general secretion pathway protein I
MTRSRGFTLLEVLVAVAVVGISMSALIAGFGRYAEQAGYLRQRTIATWVAHNRLNEVMLEPGWPGTGRKDGQVEMAGAEWPYRLEVSNTEDPQLRRIDLHVYAPEVSDIREETPSVAYLTAFLASTGRQ